MGTFPPLGGMGHGAWDISGHPWKQPCPLLLVACFRGCGSTTPQIPLGTAICDFLVEMAKEWKPHKLMILMEKTVCKPLYTSQNHFKEDIGHREPLKSRLVGASGEWRLSADAAGADKRPGQGAGVPRGWLVGPQKSLVALHRP